jgi:hypothetical protein
MKRYSVQKRVGIWPFRKWVDVAFFANRRDAFLDGLERTLLRGGKYRPYDHDKRETA